MKNIILSTFSCSKNWKKAGCSGKYTADIGASINCSTDNIKVPQRILTFTIVSRMKSYSNRFNWSCKTGGKSMNSTPFLASCDNHKFSGNYYRRRMRKCSIITGYNCMKIWKETTMSKAWYHWHNFLFDLSSKMICPGSLEPRSLSQQILVCWNPESI